MPFLAYFAALIIAALTAAFSLDLLTAPPPELKQKVALARNSAPKAIRQIPIGQSETPQANAAGDDRALSPIYPANPAAAMAAKSGAPAEVKAETTGAAVAMTPEVTASPLAPSVQPVAAPLVSAQTASTQPVVQAATVQNRCDVQACAGAYKSFRESDCTYQSFGGERRVCTRLPGETQERVAAQPPSQTPQSQAQAQPQNQRPDANARLRKDAELRAVERRVRELTDREMASNDGERRARGVVVLEAREGFAYDAPEPYTRRWDTPRWR